MTGSDDRLGTRSNPLVQTAIRGPVLRRALILRAVLPIVCRVDGAIVKGGFEAAQAI